MWLFSDLTWGVSYPTGAVQDYPTSLMLIILTKPHE
jgi:hypothetical protein